MTPSVVPPLGMTPVGHQPPAEGALTPGQSRTPGHPIQATVVATTRLGPLIEAGGQRFLLQGVPVLPEGASLSLELADTGRQGTAGRLIAVAGRVLEAPVAVRLQPAPAEVRAPAERPPPAAGVQVEARLFGPDGRAAGSPIPIRLTAIGQPTPDSRLAPGLPEPPGPAVVGPERDLGGRPAAAPDQAAGAGRPVTAEVAGPDPSGRLLLRAAGLTFRLETTIDVPAGARLQLVLPTGFAPRQEQPAPAGDPFHRLIDALLQRTPAADDAVGADRLRLPAPDHALAARLLRWIETLTAPSAGAGAGHEGPEPDPATGTLRSALSELGQHAREPQAGGWRVLVMPLGVEDPNALRLYLRDVQPERERAKAGRDRRSAGQRAVFELEFSELGRCQLDVLCRARRFDLAVRTERPLDSGLQDDIRGLFRAACTVAGWAGEVEFRAAGLLSLPDPLAPVGHAYTA